MISSWLINSSWLKQNKIKLIFFAAVFFLVAMRDPLVIFQPRFWAEEGTVFYAHSLQSGFFDGIIFTPRATAGYFLLAATIPATVAAKFVKPEYAPFVTTYFSLFLYLSIFWIILWRDSYIFDSLFKKLIACLIVLFFPYTQATQEAWLNTINLQIYCGLLALLIAIDPREDIKGIQIWLSRGALVFCGLSGIYAIALSPLFASIWLWRRTRESLIRTLIIGATGGLQFFLFLYLKYFDLLSAKKLVTFFWAKSAVAVLYYQMMLPVFGTYWGGALLDKFNLKQALSLPVGDSYQYALLAGWISLVLITTVLMMLVGKRSDVRIYLLLIGFLCVSLVTSIFSTGGIPGGRYSVLPSILFGMLLLTVVCLTSRCSVIRKVTVIFFLVFGIVSGFLGYLSEIQKNWDLKRPKPPDWALQIQEWRQNPDQVLNFWPYPKWPGVLPDPTLSQDLRNILSETGSIELRSDNNLWQTRSITVNGLPAFFSFSFNVLAKQQTQGIISGKLQVLVLGKMDENMRWMEFNISGFNSIHKNRIYVNSRKMKIISKSPLFRGEKIMFRFKSNIISNIKIYNFRFHSVLAAW